MEGPAVSSKRYPAESCIARTLPYAPPARITSPRFSVPSVNQASVATGPRPRSSSASIDEAGQPACSGWLRRSSTSACSAMRFEQLDRHRRAVSAETRSDIQGVATPFLGHQPKTR